MPRVRIYLFTYKRNTLLLRSLKSLLGQTYADWVCEVHNDCPEDRYPDLLINSINDQRFIVKNHNSNLGGVQSFNLAFNGCKEHYATILEDDNWWEPDFLSIMIKELDENQAAEVGVANEMIWKEDINGNWTDTKKTIWHINTSNTLYYPSAKDLCGSPKICNSSMLWRTGNSKNWITPNDIPIDITEHFRERLMPFPLLLINRPLVNYGQTLNSYRSSSVIWGSYQVMLISSVICAIGADKRQDLIDNLWQIAENNQPFKTTLLHSAFSNKSARKLLLKTWLFDLIRYALTWIYRPKSSFKTVNAPKIYRNQWILLLKITQNILN